MIGTGARVLSYPDAFPMVGGGGRFLMVVGAGIMLGAVFPRARDRLLAAGGGLGVAAAVFLSGAMDRGHGAPGAWQIGSLIFAIAVEMAVLPVLRRRLRPHGERTLLLGILVLVGAHFLLMAPAFGPMIVLLGFLAIFNAWCGLRFPAIDFRVVWLADGCFKLAVGALMWLASPSLPAFGW